MTNLKRFALVLALFLSTAVYGGNTVPFNATIDTEIAQTGFCGAACVSLRITGSGIGLHFGVMEIDGPLDINFATLGQTGTSTMTAADGSTLTISFTGSFVPGAVPGDATFSGEWAVISGTRRFKNTDGEGAYSGSASGPAGILHLSGTLSMGK